MAQSKIVQLVNKLLDGTRNGKVIWELTSPDNVFHTSFPDYSINITFKEKITSDGPINDYFLQIYNQRARLIEEYSDMELGEELGDGNMAFEMMREMFSIARRNALGVDKALDEILAALDSMSIEDAEDLPF